MHKSTKYRRNCLQQICLQSISFPKILMKCYDVTSHPSIPIFSNNCLECNFWKTNTKHGIWEYTWKEECNDTHTPYRWNMMAEQMINHYERDEFAELLSPDYREIIIFFPLSRSITCLLSCHVWRGIDSRNAAYNRKTGIELTRRRYRGSAKKITWHAFTQACILILSHYALSDNITYSGVQIVTFLIVTSKRKKSTK